MAAEEMEPGFSPRTAFENCLTRISGLLYNNYSQFMVLEVEGDFNRFPSNS